MIDPSHKHRRTIQKYRFVEQKNEAISKSNFRE